MSRGVTRQSSVLGSAVSLATQTETVIATLTGISTDGNSQIVVLTGIVPLTPDNADVTGVQFKIRRNSLTGTAVETLTPDVQPVTASDGGDTYTVMAQDQPGEVANLSYVLTAKSLTGTHTCTVGAPILAAVVQ